MFLPSSKLLLLVRLGIICGYLLKKCHLVICFMEVELSLHCVTGSRRCGSTWQNISILNCHWRCRIQAEENQLWVSLHGVFKSFTWCRYCVKMVVWWFRNHEKFRFLWYYTCTLRKVFLCSLEPGVWVRHELHKEASNAGAFGGHGWCQSDCHPC